MKKNIYTLLLILFLLAPIFVHAESFPDFPMAFWGNVSINGNPAPVGTVVRSYYGSVLAGTTTVQESGMYGCKESIKQKLIVGEGTGQLNFTFQSASLNGGLETSGCSGVGYEGFTSGLTVEKDLIFYTTGCGSSDPVVTKPAPVSSGGGGGGGGYTNYTPINPNVIINNGENTTFETQVALNLSANYMDSSRNPLQMIVSNYADFHGAEWINYATSTNWTLIDGVGLKTVYTKFKNSYGVSAVVSDTIELQIKPAEIKPTTETEKPVLNQSNQPKVLGAQIDMVLSKKLSGQLLLQVEQGGSIWYVDTINFNRYSVTWANALPLFQKLSLGITDANLAKIPIADSGQVGNWTLRNSLKGKLLLQVEQGGAIWYVDLDGYRHSVTWNNLMDLFRKLALGISDENLNKIAVGDLDLSSGKVAGDKNITIEESLGEKTESNPLGLKANLLIKNNKFVETFYVDENLCLKWIINEQAAYKNFGDLWWQKIKGFDEIPKEYNFCGNLE
jgi:hypothetical protein